MEQNLNKKRKRKNIRNTEKSTGRGKIRLTNTREKAEGIE